MKLQISLALAGIGLSACLSMTDAASQSHAPGPFSALAPDCEIAAIDKEHLFLAVGVYQGETLTNIQMGPDSVTTAVRVVIKESGAKESKKPITLLVQADTPVIWDFENSGDRIQRVIVIAPNRQRAAIHGLDAKQVEFFKMTRCFAPSIPFREGAAKSESMFREIFGRAPDYAAFSYQAYSLGLPELKFAEAKTEGPERNTDTVAEKALLHFYPGGFRLFDIASLISPAEMSIPETYPGEAGLIQLERSGAIRQPKAEEVAAFAEGFSKPYRFKADPNFLARIGFSYVMTRDAMLPAGLYGAHARSFLVLAGVQPRGNAGHGCLGFMDGFRTNDGATCHGEMSEALRRLKDLPPLAATTACRVLDVPSDTSVEAVSIYQPTGAKHSFRSKRNAEPVDLQVSKPGNVLLVLNSYEPAIWRVSAGKDTRIVGVVLVSYYTSQVEGIGPNTPIVTADYEGRESRARPTPGCEWAHGYTGTSFRGGPEAMVLNRQVETLTGKSLDGLRGNNALSSVEIR